VYLRARATGPIGGGGAKNISGYVPYYKDRDELKFANMYRDKNVN